MVVGADKICKCAMEFKNKGKENQDEHIDNKEEKEDESYIPCFVL